MDGYTPQEKLDLAVLEVLSKDQERALPGGIPQLPTRDRNTLQVTERVWTVDSEWTIVPNNLSALGFEGDPQQFQYTKGATDDGFSGGAVFDDDGRIVGFHRGRRGGVQCAVAVKIDAAVDVLGLLGHPAPNLVRSGATVVSGGGTSSGPAVPPKATSGAEIGDTRVNSKDGLTYVWIQPGRFMMGCSPGDSECFDNEKPAHAVTISKGFWIGQTEVIQEAYERVIETNPSHFRGAKLPVDSVVWDKATAYCRAIGGRLPTEAEWEYAARAGSTSSRYRDIDSIAWHGANSGGKTHEVAQKQANAFGLYDTLGNVWEWVADWYATYPSGSVTDPRGPATGQHRVLRGSSSFVLSRYARVSYRANYEPHLQYWFWVCRRLELTMSLARPTLLLACTIAPVFGAPDSVSFRRQGDTGPRLPAADEQSATHAEGSRYAGVRRSRLDGR
jgi:formylglycine-generating enzyme required for sulfatase activity